MKHGDLENSPLEGGRDELSFGDVVSIKIRNKKFQKMKGVNPFVRQY